MSYIAKCQCERVCVECQTEPEMVWACHCHACQRRTGAPVAVIAYFRAETLNFSGDKREFVRYGDGGAKVTNYFCLNCGTTVHYEAPEVLPGLMAIDSGLFNEKNFPKPSMACYTKRRCSWLLPFEDVPSFEAAPT